MERQTYFLIYLGERVCVLLHLCLNDVANKRSNFSEHLMGGVVEVCPRYSIPCWLLNSQLPTRIPPGKGVLARGSLKASLEVLIHVLSRLVMSDSLQPHGL